jgi:hypothetical protein
VALDALTLTRVADGEDILGSHQRLTTWDVVPSNSYPTGGYTITPQRFGLKKIRAVITGRSNTAGIGTLPQYNSQTGKLMMLSGALAQVAGSTDLSTFSFRIMFIGE